MMGYNTVAVILNDGVGMMGKDPEFGARVDAAVLSFSVRHLRPGRNSASAVVEYENGAVHVHGGALTVISQAQTDHEQVVIVGGNTGQCAEDANDLGWVRSSGDESLP